MADRIVRYIITGDSVGAVKAMKATELAAGSAGAGLERTGSKLKSLGGGMSSFGHKLSALSLPLIAVGGYSIKMAMDFQSSMTQLQTQAGASSKEVKYLEKAVLGLGHTGFDGKELSEALYPIRSDGFKGAEALNVLKGAAAGAQVSGANLTLTANALGGTLRTRLKDVHNAAEGMQILNSTVGLGKFKLEELDEALTTGFLTASKRAGVGLAETGDALDALARKSVPPQIEATRLQKTLIQFSTVTGVAKKELGKIGIGQLQLAEDMKKHGLIFALQELQDHLKKLPSAEQNVVLGEAFGRSKGSANVGALLESLPEMEKIQKQREKYGSIFKALGVRESNASFKMAEAIATFKNSLIQLGQVLIPTVIPALVKFSKLIITGIEWLKRMPKPVKDVIVGFTLLLAVGGPLLIFFGNMISAVGSVYVGLGKLIPVLKVFGTASATAGEEVGASGLAADMAKFGASIPLVEITAFVAAMYALQHIPTPKWLGGEGKGQSGKGKRKSLLESAASANPFAGKGVIAEAGATPAEEKASLQRWLRSQVHPGVSSAAALAAAGMAPVSPAAAAATRASTEMTKVDLHVEGRIVAEAIVPHLRNNMTLVKPVAEGVAKYAQNRAARE